MTVKIDRPKKVPTHKKGKKCKKDKALKIEKKQAKGKVVIESPGVSEKIIELVLSEREFYGPTANVGFSMGFTHNCGDYESVKMQVSVNIPCLPTKDELDAAFEVGTEWVDAKLYSAKKAFFKANKHLRNGKKI